MKRDKIFRTKYSFFKNCSNLICFLIGWKPLSIPLDQTKYVLLGAHHTSNWDFIIGHLVMSAIGLKLTWIGKDSLFCWPFGWFMRKIGGIPVNRRIPTNFVQQMIDLFNQRSAMILAMAPEGTRKKTGSWKTGFYYIASGAKVPILFAYLDYKRKTGGVGRIFIPTGNLSEDIKIFQQFYSKISGKYPEKQGDISF
jgi:1-acyl-sn-glycerol-3-phosphate acyltransferase